MDTYICSKCKIEKPVSEFSAQKHRTLGHKSQCKLCCKTWRQENKDRLSIATKAWVERNKEKIKERRKSYYLENKEKIDSYNELWRNSNPERCKEIGYKHYRENKDRIKVRRLKRTTMRLKTDELYKLTCAIRCAIRYSIRVRKYRKKSKTSVILGCSFDEFKKYIENQFEPWMNWDNYGKYNGELNYGWDLDHKIPTSSAKTEEDIYILNHYTNFQPMCSFTNRYIKKDKNINPWT